MVGIVRVKACVSVCVIGVWGLVSRVFGAWSTQDSKAKAWEALSEEGHGLCSKGPVLGYTRVSVQFEVGFASPVST